jgi:hypothetical protein
MPRPAAAAPLQPPRCSRHRPTKPQGTVLLQGVKGHLALALTAPVHYLWKYPCLPRIDLRRWN